MKPRIPAVLLTLGLGTACWGQQAQEKDVPSECTKVIRVNGSFPKGPFTFLPKESYKGSPLIKYQIQEDGSVSDAKIARGSGVVDIDKKVLDAVAHWKYKPRAVGCGTIEIEMSVTIDWAQCPVSCVIRRAKIHMDDYRVYRPV
jgi:TonB family protein